MKPGTSALIEDWWGAIRNTEPGAEFAGYFERQDLGRITYFDIDFLNPAVQWQIGVLRGRGKIVHQYGTLFSNGPDRNGSQIHVHAHRGGSFFRYNRFALGQIVFTFYYIILIAGKIWINVEHQYLSKDTY
jgi:hypothetical protein